MTGTHESNHELPEPVKLTRQEELFLRRVGMDLAARGEEPTRENIEAAMRRTLERDREIWEEFLRQREMVKRGTEAEENTIGGMLARAIYNDARAGE